MNSELISLLKTEAEKYNLELSVDQLEKFRQYAEELITWNTQINLTSITEPRAIIIKHFLDSLSVLQSIPQSASTLIDIGSGAGFPGIPLALVRPTLSITLIEAINKKTAFLEHIISVLSLPQVHVLCARAEDCGHNPDHRDHYDVVTARAVAHLSTLAEYALPFLKIGGRFIAQKSTTDELPQAEQALLTLGGKVQKIIPIYIDSLEERQLIIIEKISSTPDEFPRRTGVPLKKPL